MPDFGISFGGLFCDYLEKLGLQMYKFADKLFHVSELSDNMFWKDICYCAQPIITSNIVWSLSFSFATWVRAICSCINWRNRDRLLTGGAF